MAQHFEKGTPTAKTHTLPAPETIVFNTDTISFQHFAKNSREWMPMQAGVTIPLNNKAIMQRGKWSFVAPNHFVWSVEIEASSASALSLYLNNFNLRQGQQLYIYSKQLNQVMGAFTDNNNGLYFTPGIIESNRLIVEFNSKRKLQELPFEFNQLGVILRQQRSFGGAGSCEVPVNCSEGQSWQHQKRGVARVLVKQANALFWCTGSLINNTKNDGTAFFLTANHCGMGSTSSDYNQWVFDFDYESANCERPVTEPEKRTLTGAQLIANGSTPRAVSSDFKLLLLNEEVPDEYHLYFNGWNRSGDIPQHGVVIHHPAGDIKFISTYTNPATSSFYYGSESSDGPFWKVYWSETENGHGVTEGGSSGSPLFDENKLIVGTLTGGNASCINNTEPDYFGKFSDSWSKNGIVSANQLQPWLDPLNTGAVKWEGYFKGSNIVVADFNSEVTKIIERSYIEFNNLSEGNISYYRWEFEGGVPAESNEKNPGLIYYDKPGTYSVKLVASSDENADSIVRKEYIKVIGNIYPNPFIIGNGIHREIHILTGNTPLSNAEVTIYDITGKLIEKPKVKTGFHEITINPYNLSAGTYLISTLIDGKQSVWKIVVVNNSK